MRMVAWALAVATAAGVARGQADDGAAVVRPAETPAERDARMGWWREARFGLFVHWGLYAVPAGAWGEETHHAEWIRTTAQIPLAEYDRLVQRFDPQAFDAGRWAALARRAGMKYIVITSKHHDGFCLFDSAHTDFDVMATPLRRDIMAEIAEAFRGAGLRIGWYHSIMDWHHPDYLPRRGWEVDRPTAGADLDRYVAYMKAQVRELLTNYGPIDVLWFDGEWEPTWTHERGLDLYAYVRSLQPEVIVNNRVDKGRAGMAGMTTDPRFAGDFGTPEQEIPPTGLPGVDWETCMTMNDHWGWNRADGNWKSTADLVRKLVDVASKGGNFLLNVGPTAAGEFPPGAVERLTEIGEWMDVYGDAIYGTQAGPFADLPWGRCTQKPLADGRTRLYLHVFDWPADGKLRVPGIANAWSGARLMGDDPPLPVSRHEDAVVIAVPAEAPNTIACVVELDIAGAADVYAAPDIQAAGDTLVDALDVTVAGAGAGEVARYTLNGTTPTAAAPAAQGPIRITDTTEVRARRFRDGRPVSPVAARTFRRVTPRPGVKTGTLARGLRYDYYEGEWERLPDFAGETPVRSGVTPACDLAPRGRAERFALHFTGLVRVPADGIYTFTLRSDDGSRLWIGETLVVDNDGLHVLAERAGRIALGAGLHPIRVGFFERTGDDGLEVLWAGPGVASEPLRPDALFHEPR